MLDRVEGLQAGNPMPPTKALPPELVDIYKAWVMAGMPNTAADAAKLTAPTVTLESPATVVPTTPLPESAEDTLTPPPVPEVTPVP